jgi:hypothetical protein
MWSRIRRLFNFWLQAKAAQWPLLPSTFGGLADSMPSPKEDEPSAFPGDRKRNFPLDIPSS